MKAKCIRYQVSGKCLLSKKNCGEGNKEYEILATRYDVSKIYQDKRLNHAKYPQYATKHISDQGLARTKRIVEDLAGFLGITMRTMSQGTCAFYLRQKLLQFNQTEQLRLITVMPLTTKVRNAGLVEPCQECD